jgi:prepilin-type N-terminal cleavage/methylation domain-containing protein
MTRISRPLLADRARASQGFTLLELLVVVAIVGILAAVAIGVMPNVIGMAKAESGAQQLGAFLNRYREQAISRRRNIEIEFVAPNVVRSLERAIPNPPAVTPAPTLLETMVLEGGIEFTQFAEVGVDTPDAFGDAAAINLGGASPVLFTSEGSFTDVNGDPINASIFLGAPARPDTANAVNIIGATAAVRLWRYDGSRWVQ